MRPTGHAACGHRAPMESLDEQMNLRVKGTEMFWNEGRTGGEDIVQYAPPPFRR